MDNSAQTRNVVDITIRLGFLILIIAWCVTLLIPFTSVILWGIILAIAANPFYKLVLKKFGGRKKLSAFCVVMLGLLAIAIPSWLFLDSIISGVSDIKSQFETGSFTVPVPAEKVKEWPLIGPKLYQFWVGLSTNLGETIGKYDKQLLEIGNVFFKQLMGIGGSIVQMIVAILIAGVLLVTQMVDGTLNSLFVKLMGKRGEEFALITTRTVNNVVKGVIGVALIQAALVGIGFLLAKVPYAGLWALLVFILAILQLPPAIVVVPVVLYLFSELSIVPAILWTIYFLLAGASDNILKPILLGKGAPVPMLVIFLGVLGGFITSGFIGLFTGAIVLSIGYKLFITWLKPEDKIEG